MVQFNLLPDVKQQFVKARRLMHLVTLSSIAASAVALFILVLLLAYVDVVQKNSLNNVDSHIKTSTNQLKSVSDLDKILTVQNQLNTLPGLHDQKVVSSQLFTYISQVTPTNVTIGKLDIDFTLNTITITGDAPSLDVINGFTDTLKQTTYKSDAAGSVATKAFSAVVLASFGRDSTGATYNITFTFDPLIFNSANKTPLTVPVGAGGVQPQGLFQKQAGN
jgi:hypothetical protein